MAETLDPQQVNPQNINSFKQNRASLIARDLAPYGIPFRVSIRILMARGVFKWFAVRRNLIRLKSLWRKRLIKAYTKRVIDYEPRHAQWMKGYIYALEQCRAEVRALCHSERWQFPDNDPMAREMLEKTADG